MIPRQQLLKDKSIKKGGEKIRCIETYDINNREVKRILDKYRSLLKTDSDLSEVLTDNLSITYRQDRNLRELYLYFGKKKDLKITG